MCLCHPNVWRPCLSSNGVGSACLGSWLLKHGPLWLSTYKDHTMEEYWQLCQGRFYACRTICKLWEVLSNVWKQNIQKNRSFLKWHPCQRKKSNECKINWPCLKIRIATQLPAFAQSWGGMPECFKTLIMPCGRLQAGRRRQDWHPWNLVRIPVDRNYGLNCALQEYY